MGETVILVIGCVVVLGAIIAALCSKKEEQPADDPQAKFKAAKAEMEHARYDAETGEYYAYKITRVPAQAPPDKREPTIVEPMARKART